MGSGFGRSLQARVPEVRPLGKAVRFVLNLSIQTTESNRRGGMPFTFLKLGGWGYID